MADFCFCQTMPISASGAPCPCGRLGRQGKPLLHGECCGPYIDDFQNRPAPDAEALMRSRYSAFVREDAAYLLATWHASQRPATLAFDPGVKWLGLAVKAHRRLSATSAEVEFVARQRDHTGKAVRLHERSRFTCEEGRWFYVDGDQHE
jgi:SEC-C motif-containing protein